MDGRSRVSKSVIRCRYTLHARLEQRNPVVGPVRFVPIGASRSKLPLRESAQSTLGLAQSLT